MKLTEKKLKEIISESIKKYLKENNQSNITIEDLEEIVGYKYYPDEPHKFATDMEFMVDNVLDVEKEKANGEEPMFETDYPNCDPQMIGQYIEVYRNKMNEDYMTVYNEMKQKQINANNILDELTQKFINFKQGNY